MAHHLPKLAGAALLLACTGVLLMSPAGAQNRTLRGIPCRVSWEDTTHGGDWQTVQGEAELTQIAPQADGSFVAIGYGHATVTYHSANGCAVEGQPWTANYMVTMMSQDGQTAEIDIDSNDDPHEVVACPATGHMQFDVDAPGLPTVTAPLHEGATPFSQEHRSDHGAAGDRGAVTLHYCTEANPSGH